ncbi:hypothetical protein A4X06_0g9565, partial [Tilletia controversa]
MDRDLRRVRLISYVDDNLLYVASNNADQNARILRKAYKEAHKWAMANGLRYDAEKKDFIEFVAPRTSSAVAGKIELRDGTVEAVEKMGSFRWLGVHFDAQLRFKQHVGIIAASAKQAAGGMAMLMNTQKGMRVSDSRRLYIACIQSRLTYAAAIPPPDADTTKKNPESLANAKRLESAQHAALLRAFPAFKTTSQSSLQVEAACPPMRLVLDHCLDRAALRIAGMDQHNAMRARVTIEASNASAILPSTGTSRATTPPVAFDHSRNAVTRPFSTRLTALARRVPRNIEPATSSMQQGSAGALGNHPQVYIEGRADWKLPGAGQMLERTGDSSSIEIYTDGSQLDDGSRISGAGWVIYQEGQVLERNHQCTGQFCEVFDAEAVALMQGTVRGITLASQLNAKEITVYTDNQSVLQSLRSMSSRSSTQVFAVLSLLLQTYLDGNPDCRVAFRWVRGHTDVPGNEAADHEAKMGAEDGCFQAPGALPA